MKKTKVRPMPIFVSQVQVRAAKISSIESISDHIVEISFVDDEFHFPIHVGKEWAVKHGLNSNGYYVTREDLSHTFMSTREFERNFKKS